MDIHNPILLRTALLTAVLGTGSVLAESTPPAGASASASPPVVTDAAPPPAEDRSSPGAIVLENSLVRAQREQGFERSAAQNGLASVGRGSVRAVLRAQTQADLAQARQAERVDLRDRGAGSLVKQ